MTDDAAGRDSADEPTGVVPLAYALPPSTPAADPTPPPPPRRALWIVPVAVVAAVAVLVGIGAIVNRAGERAELERRRESERLERNYRQAVRDTDAASREGEADHREAMRRMELEGQEIDKTITPGGRRELEALRRREAERKVERVRGGR